MSGSGSRLPGDSESNDRHKSEERAEARLKGTLSARFAEYVDSHDVAKSEVVRNALDEYLPDSEGSQYVLPEDPELADAYLALAGDEKRVMTVDKAKSVLCQETHPNTAKKLIREEVLEPLAETPFLTVSYGRVALLPLTPKDNLAGGDDDE
ncbi:hypothetical protein EGH21_05495 [Halomicroarcula sp. F13]|uniref:Transcriptional regulator n=1 Tax=Haloarcula rubra TaxID=2487747 RepID=A0AAW4PMV2_9EURY|nr:hypothetical protein [Halomicroarcula rubra]MBX0322481.1 hypothetical protein [Halomicroarcula rubra]